MTIVEDPEQDVPEYTRQTPPRVYPLWYSALTFWQEGKTLDDVTTLQRLINVEGHMYNSFPVASTTKQEIRGKILEFMIILQKHNLVCYKYNGTNESYLS